MIGCLSQKFHDFYYIVTSQIDTQQLSIMGSHAHNVVCPDFIDDQKVVIVTTNQESSRTALHAPLYPTTRNACVKYLTHHGTVIEPAG